MVVVVVVVAVVVVVVAVVVVVVISFSLQSHVSKLGNNAMNSTFIPAPPQTNSRQIYSHVTERGKRPNDRPLECVCVWMCG